MEAEIRLNFGLALEMTNNLQHGFEQVGLAATLSPAHNSSLRSFVVRHPSYEAALASSQSAWQAQIAARQESREQQYRQTVLATQTQRPATPFELLLLSGPKVSLRSYAGTPLVVAFWATWCGPCHPELGELDRIFTSDPSPAAKLLTVSVDSDEAAVRLFIGQKGYRFPVALSHGSIDEAYQATTIPQLYVIDAQGRIRFHVTGYEGDGYFGKKLHWMIQAAQQPMRP